MIHRPTGYNILLVSPPTTAAIWKTIPPAHGDVTYLGKLRFPGYAGICGRVAISSIQAGGTVTLTPNIPQPYLRKDPASGTIAVDLWDASMTLIVGNVNLTRIDDSTFTFASGVITTPVWMTAHGFDWTKYDASSKRTGVHLAWSFNQRANRRWLRQSTHVVWHLRLHWHQCDAVQLCEWQLRRRRRHRAQRLA